MRNGDRVWREGGGSRRWWDLRTRHLEERSGFSRRGADGGKPCGGLGDGEGGEEAYRDEDAQVEEIAEFCGEEL